MAELVSDTNSRVSRLSALVMEGGTERPQYLQREISLLTKNIYKAAIRIPLSRIYIYNLPSDLCSGLHCAIIVHLHVIIVTVDVVLQVEGVKGQSNQVAGGNTDVPGAFGSMGVVVGVAGAGEGARRSGQGITTAWDGRKRTTGQHRMTFEYFLSRF